MAKKILTLFSIFLVQMIVQALPPCREVVYDHYLLVLTWPTEYCSQNICIRNWNSQWDGKSLVIHGLWPASSDLGYVTCLIQNQYDPYCYQPYRYDQFQFSSKQIQQMRKYWPKLTNARNFWSHQWMKHGTCYLDLVKNKYKSSLKLSQIYKSYFLETVKKTKSLGISLSKGKVKTKADLAKNLKIDVDSFYAYCGQDDQLDQIKICYSIESQPGKQKIKKCPKNNDYNLCGFPIMVK